MEPVAGHLSAAGRTLPGHPVRPQDDLAAQDRMPEAADGQSADGSARYNFLCFSSRPAVRAAALTAGSDMPGPRST
jgi:hypothetical protein